MLQILVGGSRPSVSHRNAGGRRCPDQMNLFSVPADPALRAYDMAMI
jgi:hypothetical protein